MITVRQRLRRMTPRKVRPYLGALRRKIMSFPIRVYLQKRSLLESSALDGGQVALLRRASSRIHYQDGMYNGNGKEYFLVGSWAVRCIDEVLSHAKAGPVRDILDLPCGYGRELRFLVLRFPESTFTACDIQPGAVDFCVETFGAVPAYSQPQLSQVSLDRSFDLIWCGSLVTHLNRADSLELIKVFCHHLKPGGILVFTTYGDEVFERMRSGATYDLREESLPALLASYTQTGYGYQDYPRGFGYFDFHPKGRGYGVSLMSPDWVRGLVQQLGVLREVYFRERGWADHHDVFGFLKA